MERMPLREGLDTQVGYCRKLLNSGLEGVRIGREEFLDGETFDEFLEQSVRNAFRPAAIGACIGAVGSWSGSRRNSVGRTLALSALGGMVAFGASLIWNSRHLSAAAARTASKNIARVRDERWMEENSIAYA